MQFVRKALLVILTPLLPVLLFATAIDVGFVRTTTHPEVVKKVLNDSGIYSSIIAGELDQAKKITTTNAGDVPLNDPTIKNAAETTFTPAYLKTQTETVIDSIYAWLDGKTPSPDFKIDLSGPKADFADSVAQSLQTRLTALPACTAATTPTSFDAYSATCLPNGVTAASAATQAKNSILSGKGFLDKPVLSADTVKTSDANPQSIFDDKLKNAPKQYQRAKKTPAILTILTALVLVAIIFLRTSLRQGLRHAGITLIIVGAVLLAFAWGLNQGVNQKILPRVKLNNPTLQAKVRVLVSDLTHNIDRSYWQIGGSYAVGGALAIAGSMMVGRSGGGKKQRVPTRQPTVHEPTSPAGPTDHKPDYPATSESMPQRVTAPPIHRAPEAPEKKAVKVKIQ